ncbi:MAG: LysE family translocator [Rhodospirillales bacterium]|nr:LysE family translocator [Rhodospirillales bacterium]
MLLWSLIVLAFVGSITPGPNNLMVMAASAAYGWRRTVPHMLGILIGFGFMLAVVTVGLGAVILELPVLLNIVKSAGAAWLLWLAFRMARATLRPATSDAGAARSDARPLSMVEAMLFQWVNPKGWAIALAVAGGYVELSPSITVRTLVISSIFMVCTPIANGTWMAAGEALRRVFSDPRSGRVFGLAMATLIAATALMIVLDPTDLSKTAQ